MKFIFAFTENKASQCSVRIELGTFGGSSKHSIISNNSTSAAAVARRGNFQAHKSQPGAFSKGENFL